MNRSDYKDVLGFEPPVSTIAAIILMVVVFAICFIGLGFALAKYF